MQAKPSMTTTIHTTGSKEKPTSKIMLLEAGNITPEFACIQLGVYGAMTEIFIDTDAETLQAWATEFHLLADNLLRKAIAKEDILELEAETDTRPLTDPEHEVYHGLPMEVM